MEQSFPKRRHIKFRRRGITQKKTYKIFDYCLFFTKLWPVFHYCLFFTKLWPVFHYCLFFTKLWPVFHYVLLAVHFIVSQLSAFSKFMFFTDMLLCCGIFNLTDFLQLRNVLSARTRCYELCETTTNQKYLIKIISKTLLQAIPLLENIGHKNNKRNTRMIDSNV
jgi:hypothetical protein